MIRKLLFLLVFVFFHVVISAQQTKTYSFNSKMKSFPDSAKFLVTESDDHCPFSKAGWYYSQAGVEETENGLVAVYRKSDFHTANYTDIMVAYSSDKGKTWSGHHSIAHADVWNEGGCWVAPQFSKLKSGRLVIIADFGQRNTGQDWPMLSQWQKENRGMANYLFWSDDLGKTWSGPKKLDDVGGEPSYISELSNGCLIYTRTKSKETDILWNPPLPWNNIYYYNEAVISCDGGETWTQGIAVGDDPHQGDCEVGLVEYKPKNLLAISRIGMGGGQFGQPSRLINSTDSGYSWQNHRLSPIYGQRAIVHQLNSGNLLVTYRNRWGTPGTYALVFDPEEELPYEPASFIFKEERCHMIEEGTMTLETDEGIQNLVIFTFYPAQNPSSKIEISADLKVEEADINGVNVSAGCWISIRTDRISLSDSPEHTFKIDATKWHNYKFLRENQTISIYVDGELKLEASTEGLETRMVQVGNRQIKSLNLHQSQSSENSLWHTKSKSHWKSLSVKVDNPFDYDIDWKWNPSLGFPDQFRRDRIIVLDRIAASYGHSGYSGWTQMKDGTIVIADYTVGGNGQSPSEMPFIRTYVTNEKVLSNQ